MSMPLDSTDDLRLAAHRFKAGHRLALLTALLLILGAVAKATGAPSWLVATLWATTAACAVLVAAWMVPTYVRFRKMAKAVDTRSSGGGQVDRRE